MGTATGLYRRPPTRTFSLIEPGSDADVAEDLAGTIWISDPHEAFRVVGQQATGPDRDSRARAPAEDCWSTEPGRCGWAREAAVCCASMATAGVDGARIERFTRRQGLLSDELRALFQDRDGSVWIGSRRGLSRLSASNVRAVLNRTGTDDFVAAVITTRDGAVWTAPASGSGPAIRCDGAHVHRTRRAARPHRDRAARRPAAHSGWPQRWAWRVWSARFVAVSTPGGVWSGYQIRSMTSERDGTCGCATRSAACSAGRTASSRPSATSWVRAKPYSVHADRADRVWIGYWAGGLSVVDHGTVSTTAPAGAPAASVNSIFEDRTGSLWIGTEHDLGRVEGAARSQASRQRLPSGRRTSMVEDDAGAYWMGLGAALLRVDPREFDLAASNHSTNCATGSTRLKTGCRGGRSAWRTECRTGADGTCCS